MEFNTISNNRWNRNRKEINYRFLNGTVLPNIKAAQDRYSKAIENGKNGGRTKIELPIEEIEDLISKGKTQKEVAALYNVSVDTIQRRLKNIEREPQNRKWNRRMRQAAKPL